MQDRDEMITFGGLELYVWKCVGPDSFIQIWLAVTGNCRYDSVALPPFYIKRQPGITEQSSENLISGFEVYPFRNALNIKFQIPNPDNQANPKSQIKKVDSRQKSVVSLKIYDATGRLVRLFNHLNNYQSPILWFGDDETSHKLPAGVYFVHLETERDKKIEKVILLR